MTLVDDSGVVCAVSDVAAVEDSEMLAEGIYEFSLGSGSSEDVVRSKAGLSTVEPFSPGNTTSSRVDITIIFDDYRAKEKVI